MIGDLADFVRRLVRVLPLGWFSDEAPTTEIVLSGFAAAWASVYNLIGVVTNLARVSTTTGLFLDLASSDFFGDKLPRRPGERDDTFVLRIRQELFRPRGTRAGLQQALSDLTGRPPLIVEPARPADTGGYAVGGLGYGQAGAWGSLSLARTLFVTAYRPQGGGIAELAGYGTGGPIVYGNMALVATAVSDLCIYSTAASVLPVGSIAWLRVEN